MNLSGRYPALAKLAVLIADQKAISFRARELI
jgi:hypothetical protein